MRCTEAWLKETPLLSLSLSRAGLHKDRVIRKRSTSLLIQINAGSQGPEGGAGVPPISLSRPPPSRPCRLCLRPPPLSVPFVSRCLTQIRCQVLFFGAKRVIFAQGGLNWPLSRPHTPDTFQ